MSGPLAPAAPSRLRRAAGAGAGRCAAVYLRQARDRTRVLADWARAGRQCGWLAGRARLRKGPLLGRGLDRLCGGAQERRDRTSEPKRAHKPPAGVAPGSSRPAKAADLTPRSQPPAPPARTCRAATVLPPRATLGQLRLWSGTDPAPRDCSAPARMPPAFDPARAKPVPAPGAVPDWPDKLAGRAAARFARGRLGQGPGGETGAPAFAGALARPLAGPVAPHRLLHTAGSSGAPALTAVGGAAGRDTAAAMRPPGKTGAAAPDPAAPPASRQAAAAPHPAGRSASAPGPLSGPARMSGRPRPGPVPSDTTGPARSDPLYSDTIGPPAHAAPATLPPQPDLAPPLAEVLPLAGRGTLGRPQGAVADEPLSELPPLPAVPAPPPGFDRDELGTALADILRDEARRHGIDV